MLLHSLLAATVERWPEAIAIDVPPGAARPRRQQVSYGELAARASAIGVRLRPFVAGECIVAILLDRTTPQLWAAQLAVLRAGAAFVCLDPTFPDEHVAFVLRDSNTVVLLTDEAGAARGRAAGLPGERVIDVHSLPANGSPHAEPPAWLSDASLAYVIYTSGTTGRPKGVLLQHGGVAGLIASGVARFGLGPGDRIAQGSSHAYDSSIEETWLALASGATVVAVDDETIRRGPDLVSWLRDERITVLCPPPTLLRAMHCERPARDLPRLRLCYAGGEAMPQDLCDVWAADLWLENGYGPTECTVTVVRGRLRAGEPVTIGTPVPGHRAFVLDECLDEVAPGAVGELCIAGPGLARGYLGHDALTKERFVQHPRLGRIYRTGDLARGAPDGTLTCLGRIDSQVKVRGHRIELEAIEVALAACSGVREAACRVQGDGSDAVLVACIVPVSAAAPPTQATIQRELGRTLPPAMVPAAVLVIDALPRTIGGKLDRKALPAALVRERPADGAHEAPQGEREARVAAAFAARLPGRPRVARDDDFFALGGDSLRAAQVVTDLRQHESTANLTVRDLYGARTVRGLAGIARAPVGDSRSPVAAPGEVRAYPRAVTCVQVACLALGLVFGSWIALAGTFTGAPWLVDSLGVGACLVLGPLLYRFGLLLWAPLAVWFAVLVKETLIGTYTPCSVPVWSWSWLRHWIVQRVVQFVPWRELQGTEFFNMALRALGARIGRRVHLHRGVDLFDGGWDLLELGDDVTIAQEARLGLVDLDRGRLVIGPVRIGAGATLDVRSGTGPGVEVGAGAYVTALSALPPGSRVPAGERWDGVPARAAGSAPAVPAITVRGRRLSPFGHGCLLLASRALLAPLLQLPWTLALVLLAARSGFDAATVLRWLAAPSLVGPGVAVAVALLVLTVPARLLAQALLLRWLPKARAGTIDRWSSAYCVVWLRTDAVQSAGTWLSGSLLWPHWLRLAGMQIGPKCEISTIVDVLPEHTAIGAGSFFADGIYLASPRLQAGTVTMQVTKLSADTFLGNHVVVPAGQQLPESLVLGVSTVADDRVMQAGTGWFGQPPFRLPRREVVTMDRRLTHDPSPARIAERLFWELLRFGLPLVPASLVFGWFAIVTAAEAHCGLLAWVSLVVPGASLAVAIAACTFVWALKWLLLGRVLPGQHALWSSWASRWDFLYVAWGFVARGVLAQVEGTLLQNAFARAMGARIGRRVVLGAGFAQIVDPDMLYLGDGATVSALFQAHSFEDRVLKIDHVHVGAGASVAPGAVLLYGARVGDHATVGMHGVVMKHEHLLAGRHYEGAPVAPAAVPAPMAIATAAGRPNPPTGGRDVAIDVLRGLAVLAMIWTHLVPADGGAGAGAKFGAFATEQVEAWSAAAFALLLGVGAAIAQSTAGAVLRRSLVLVAAGVVFGWSVWPTEILTALGVMLPLVTWLHRRGLAAVAFASVLVLTPLAAHCFGHFVDGDWLEDGSVPAVWTTFGWVTVRYVLFDGNYPLLPWLCFPLLGAMLWTRGLSERARAARWCWLAAVGALLLRAVELLVEQQSEAIGGAALHLRGAWGPPTTVPFVLQHAAMVLVALAGLCWWNARRASRPPNSSVNALAAVGRCSLTHYLLHVLVVVVPLRTWYPAEDWSTALGIAVCVVYVALAVPVSAAWCRSFERGPFESLLARVARGRRWNAAPPTS